MVSASNYTSHELIADHKPSSHARFESRVIVRLRCLSHWFFYRQFFIFSFYSFISSSFISFERLDKDFILLCLFRYFDQEFYLKRYFNINRQSVKLFTVITKCKREYIISLTCFSNSKGL